MCCNGLRHFYLFPIGSSTFCSVFAYLSFHYAWLHVSVLFSLSSQVPLRLFILFPVSLSLSIWTPCSLSFPSGTRLISVSLLSHPLSPLPLVQFAASLLPGATYSQFASSLVFINSFLTPTVSVSQVLLCLKVSQAYPVPGFPASNIILFLSSPHQTISLILPICI